MFVFRNFIISPMIDLLIYLLATANKVLLSLSSYRVVEISQKKSIFFVGNNS